MCAWTNEDFLYKYTKYKGGVDLRVLLRFTASQNLGLLVELIKQRSEQVLEDVRYKQPKQWLWHSRG